MNQYCKQHELLLILILVFEQPTIHTMSKSHMMQGIFIHIIPLAISFTRLLNTVNIKVMKNFGNENYIRQTSNFKPCYLEHVPRNCPYPISLNIIFKSMYGANVFSSKLCMIASSWKKNPSNHKYAETNIPLHSICPIQRIVFWLVRILETVVDRGSNVIAEPNPCMLFLMMTKH